MRKLKISLLHLAPITGDVPHNRELVRSALKVAAAQGANWVVTPELCIPGYMFMKMIGTDWILPQPDPWVQDFCQLVKELNVMVFLSHPDRDPQDDQMYNTAFVINPRGEIIGKHSKVKALRGPEAWSTPGTEISPIDCDGVQVGVLVCADAYKNDVAQILKDKGAELFVSPAAWGPGGCAPDGEWEQRSQDTGAPVIVCNRSGVESAELDYTWAESVVTNKGKRVLCATSDRSVVLSFELDLDSMTLLSDDFDRVYL